MTRPGIASPDGASAVTEALKALREEIPAIVSLLAIPAAAEIRSWTNVVNGKLLPRLSPDFPLMVAICGGGSSGKSTLFNSLVGDRLSPSGGSAGINRRILVSAPGELFRQKDFVSTLFEPFGSRSKPLENKDELRRPGCPLYILNANVPRNMVLMDTPDFDTGARGTYTNRDVVRQALETSDILIYLFTNSNYNNRDNTDFIARVLTGIGRRKCFLVYRVYSCVDNREVTEHAMTVARNLYGRDAERYVLGIYRADEDNAVAAGEKFMSPRPAREGDPPFMEALKGLDPRVLRPELLASIMTGVLEKSERMLAEARNAERSLRLYLDALTAAQGRSVREALRHFPMDMILTRFAQIWMESDPAHVRVMRRTGDYLGKPFRAISGVARWMGGRIYGNRDRGGKAEFQDKVEEDMLSAINSLHHKATSPEISVTLPEIDPMARRMTELVTAIREHRESGPTQGRPRDLATEHETGAGGAPLADWPAGQPAGSDPRRARGGWNSAAGDSAAGDSAGGSFAGGNSVGGNSVGGNFTGGNLTGGDSAGGDANGWNSAGGDSAGSNTGLWGGDRLDADAGLDGAEQAGREGSVARMEPGDEKGERLFLVPAHPALEAAREALRLRDWKETVAAVLSQKDAVIDLSRSIEADLVYLAKYYRKRMKFPDKVRQTFSAFLNVLPATVAVTYILSTGDPVGATGIKVKLTGIFGLHDLYALVALPATTGLSKADRRQLEELLAPVAEKWLNANLQTVQEIFEREITGELLGAATATLEEAAGRIRRIEETIDTCGKAIANR